MQKKSVEILKNLGFPDESINELKKEKIVRNTLVWLKDLGLPPLAIKQIKFFESAKDSAATATKSKSKAKKPKITNEDLLSQLSTKLKKNFDSFAKKGLRAVVVFNHHQLEEEKWKIYAAEYSKPIQKFHETCKYQFDEFAEQGLIGFVVFDGTKWYTRETLKDGL